LRIQSPMRSKRKKSINRSQPMRRLKCPSLLAKMLQAQRRLKLKKMEKSRRMMLHSREGLEKEVVRTSESEDREVKEVEEVNVEEVSIEVVEEVVSLEAVEEAVEVEEVTTSITALMPRASQLSRKMVITSREAEVEEVEATLEAAQDQERSSQTESQEWSRDHPEVEDLEVNHKMILQVRTIRLLTPSLRPPKPLSESPVE